MGDGLRERSRARRRRAIEAAALRLFAEKGYDATTVAQIAEAAEVSARTVTLYFPSKLDMAMSYSVASSRRLHDACLGRAPGTSVPEVLRAWLADEVGDHRDLLALHAAALATNPTLRGTETADISTYRRAVTEEFAADLGRRPDDPVAALATGAVIGIVSALLDMGVAGIDLGAALNSATELLDAVIERARAEAWTE
ncbi:TetR/AcrR family transcriptional regulator [Nocardia bovistercoris]|uniref:Helix-turn-helix transcriptional regulator n=1 Tax=Nocardia bovistercoris TaxID=2785916 RepID=A0A931N4M5_9NOCA|nr:TetR/AcrR family transcriptional regulator [Nocardia bovistercoris]MBH0777773.1 helix-turn-helix transcriptional regulator [Nocardia bovistercoris]